MWPAVARPLVKIKSGRVADGRALVKITSGRGDGGPGTGED